MERGSPTSEATFPPETELDSTRESPAVHYGPVSFEDAGGDLFI